MDKLIIEIRQFQDYIGEYERNQIDDEIWFLERDREKIRIKLICDIKCKINNKKE